jgi:hypothetical protein
MSDIFLNKIQKVPENSKLLKMILKKNRINEKCVPFGCEMIYIVKINRQKQAKISEYQQLEFLRVHTVYQKKKLPVKHKNIIFTMCYTILYTLTAFDR